MRDTLPDTIFHKDERVVLFIDGANLYQAARALGFDIDYKRLLRAFSDHARLIRAFYYTALLDEQEYSPIRPLVDWLDYNGYTMVTKPLKEYSHPTGRRKFKGNMDIEIAVDVMEMSANVDHVVLFSGDGDFRRLLEFAQRRGLRATVVSTIRTQPPMVADELRRQSDFFVDLADLQTLIARQPNERAAAPRRNVPDHVQRPPHLRDDEFEDDEDDDDYEDDFEDDDDRPGSSGR